MCYDLGIRVRIQYYKFVPFAENSGAGSIFFQEILNRTLPLLYL